MGSHSRPWMSSHPQALELLRTDCENDSSRVEGMNQRQLIVISNRLPMTLSQDGGSWQAKPSSGGLATAMEPILTKRGGLWIGWAGENGKIGREERDSLLAESARGFSYVPVDFPAGAGPAFYEGYPNQTVWPLFHYFPDRMNFDPVSWKAYVDGNRYFSEKVPESAQSRDLIWIHDYHLMLLPSMLRETQPESKIGFFLHIPFPASEVFSMLPHRDEILRGLLGADLIAFHTHGHLHHFRSSVLRILGIESRMDAIEYEGRTVRIEALPIGIAAAPLAALAQEGGEGAARMEELRLRYAGQNILIAVDRLDYTKGIPERLRTFRRLLRDRADLRGKVVLIQVAVPSREGIGEYQNLQGEIDGLVGEINGEFGIAEWSPIAYLKHPVNRPELAVLYAIAGVGWVTPLRDGMNLVAKEYCACKPEHDGVLVLSEFAGAAAEMGEALLVNPYDEEQVAGAIARALEMEPDERERRMKRLRDRVFGNDVFAWANHFLEILESLEPPRQAAPEIRDFGPIRAAFARAGSRVLILDYDGTLVEIEADPSRTAPPADLISILSRLAADPRNTVSVVSDRVAADVERLLGGVGGLWLSAERGVLIRNPESGIWQPLTDGDRDLRWKDKAQSILQHYVDRAPGSFVEEKEYSLAWHYRRVEPEFGEWLAGELTGILEGLLADTDARPVVGKKLVEIRPVWANKAMFVSRLLSESPNSEIQIGIGDDITDEDMFERLGADAYTIHVGAGHSRARFRLRSPRAVSLLLEALV